MEELAARLETSYQKVCNDIVAIFCQKEIVAFFTAALVLRTRSQFISFGPHGEPRTTKPIEMPFGQVNNVVKMSKQQKFHCRFLAVLY